VSTLLLDYDNVECQGAPSPTTSKILMAFRVIVDSLARQIIFYSST
jgi:hypothetical protein